MTVPLADQIAEVKRELAMRQNVYPRFVEQHKMTETDRVKRMSRMAAVLATLEALAKAESPELDYEGYEEESPPTATARTGGRARYIQQCEECERASDKISDWDAAFIDSLQGQLGQGRTPSPKQVAVLDRIWRKVTGG